MLIVNLEKHFNKTLAFLTTVQHTLASDLPLCLSFSLFVSVSFSLPRFLPLSKYTHTCIHINCTLKIRFMNPLNPNKQVYPQNTLGIYIMPAS